MKWTKQDKESAATQGWEVREFWDTLKKRFEYEIFKVDESKIFLTDEAARKFVQDNLTKYKLASKAAHLIFKSKMGAL